MSDLLQCEQSMASQEAVVEREQRRATGTDGAGAHGGGRGLKQLAAERLAAHRQRRNAGQSVAGQAESEQARLEAEIEARRAPQQDDAAVRVREAVAARYRESPSYREYVALESARALERAQAEAEVAQRRAEAMAEAQHQLMKELEAWRTVPGPSGNAPTTALQPKLEPKLVPGLPAISVVTRSLAAEPIEGVRVQLYEELHAVQVQAETHTPAMEPETAELVQEEMDGLEQEIEFRLAPDFADHRIDMVPIQANIIEFPRELVAPRKARPRLAEGPLREETATATPAVAETAASTPASPQLRIFEVMPVEMAPIESAPVEMVPAAGVSLDGFLPFDGVAAEPGAGVAGSAGMEPAFAAARSVSVGAPRWQGVLPADAPARLPETWPEHWPKSAPSLLMPVYAAGADRRLLSAMVDACCIALGWLGFVCAMAMIAGQHLPHVPLWLLAGALIVSGVITAVLYHWLFFTYSEATPGMLYARVSLCTFEDANPTRTQRQSRVWAVLLAALPLGWGLLSMAFEIDHLGWHDKRSRMYPREY